jgi:uncharacterized Zn finger protein
MIRGRKYLEFLIESGSSGSRYTVKVFKNSDNPVISCTCAAGENGTHCKHRLMLIDGNDSDVVESTNTVEELNEILAGTELAVIIKRMKQEEVAAKIAQATLKKTKKQLSKALLGHF